MDTPIKGRVIVYVAQAILLFCSCLLISSCEQSSGSNETPQISVRKFREVQVQVRNLSTSRGPRSADFRIVADSAQTAAYLEANPALNDTTVCFGTDRDEHEYRDGNGVKIKAICDDKAKKIVFLSFSKYGHSSALVRDDVHEYHLDYYYKYVNFSIGETPYTSTTDSSITIELRGDALSLPPFMYLEAYETKSPVMGNTRTESLAISPQPSDALIRIKLIE